MRRMGYDKGNLVSVVLRLQVVDDVTVILNLRQAKKRRQWNGDFYADGNLASEKRKH